MTLNSEDMLKLKVIAITPESLLTPKQVEDWIDLCEEANTAQRKKVFRMREEFINKNGKEYSKELITFVDCVKSMPTTAPSTCAVPVWPKPIPRTSMVECEDYIMPKKGQTMRLMYSDMDEFNAEANQLGYLGERVCTITNTKEREMRKAYGLDGDDAPRTPNELIERITSGKYVIPEDMKDSRSYYATDYITWRDPSIKKDQAGFDKAFTELKKARTAVEDFLVMSTDSAARLQALKDFETVTIQ